MFDLSSLPHKKLILSLFALAATAVLGIELSNVRFWFHESGAIHLVAILFALAAVGVLSYPGWITDEGVKVFARHCGYATILLGSAHVFEYLGDTLHIIEDQIVLAVLSSIYLAAGLTVLNGARKLLVRAGAETGRIKVMMLVLMLCQVLTLSLLFVKGNVFATTMEAALFVTLVFAGILYFQVLSMLGKKIPLIALFGRHLQVASGFILLSYAMDFFKSNLESLGFSEGRIENVLHYFFFLGLSLMLLSFDLLRHVGGVYADINKEMAAEAAK